MQADVTSDAGEQQRSGGTGLTGTFALAYLLGFGLLVALIIYGGPWSFAANTRLLDLLLQGGVVQLHDHSLGWIAGIPDPMDYMKSQDPIDWRLVGVVVGVFLLVWTIKANQFSGICRLCGIQGSLAQHMRAYFYGLGIGHLLPLRAGEVAMAKALEGQGASAGQAAQAVFIARLFILFEIAAFALIALFWIGWATWLVQMFWALVILGVAYWFLRPREAPPAEGGLQAARQTVTALLQQPGLLIGLCLMSLVSFALFDVAAYILLAAFTRNYVLLDIDSNILLMSVVCLYIARFIPITPGAVGQGEWGMAAGLVLGGTDPGAGMTVAMLVGFFRYFSVILLWGLVQLGYGIETNLRHVLEIYRGAEVQPSGAS